MGKLLITGLTGVSGSAFYDVLCRRRYPGKIKVVVRKTTNCEIFRNTPLDLELCIGDIADTSFLIEALQDCDTVFHIADKRLIQPLADAIAQVDSVQNVIMVSSTIVYSKYYRTAYLGDDEAVCVEKFERKGVKYVFLRPTMIFGLPNDRNISQFIRWFLKYPVFPIVKKGKATIQPVSRLDLAEAYWQVLQNFPSITRKEYVISGQRPMMLLEMFETICSLAERRVYFINVPFPVAKAAVETIYFLSGKRCDYREKLDRLTEDRAYPHGEISDELGYAPLSFEERVSPLIAEIKNE